MSFLMAGISAASGVAKIGMALAGSGKRKREQRRAAAELAKRKSAVEGLSTANPYKDLENTMEDLTVNTQQADFMAQQNQQNQANIMQSMQGAAGGSGIAGLAQAMANQGALAAQKSSASIGAQEAKNKQLAAQEQARLNTLEARGEARSQDLQKDKAETLLGMAQQRKGAADAARQRAKQQMMSGIGSIGGAAMAGIKAGKANIAEGKGFWDMGLKQEG